jgi:hypothetical protein
VWVEHPDPARREGMSERLALSVGAYGEDSVVDFTTDDAGLLAEVVRGLLNLAGKIPAAR